MLGVAIGLTDFSVRASVVYQCCSLMVIQYDPCKVCLTQIVVFSLASIPITMQLPVLQSDHDSLCPLQGTRVVGSNGVRASHIYGPHDGADYGAQRENGELAPIDHDTNWLISGANF